MGRALCVLWLVAGCYSPTTMEGLACSESFKCPTGQTCDIETTTCVEALPPQLKLTSMSAGADHTCGVDAQGALYCWGHNDYGQLGLGDADDRSAPTRVGSEAGWGPISSGERASCAIHGGGLWCWGDARVLGTQANRPTEMMPGTSWLTVSVGSRGYCAVSSAKILWCRWFDEPALTQRTDTQMAVEVVAASNGRQCVIDIRQNLFCWGTNSTGQVGNGSTVDVDMPYQIDGTWRAIAAGPWHTCAINTAGELSCWGDCGSGAVLDAPHDPRDGYCVTPKKVGTDTYDHVTAGTDHTCAINSAHQIICFGQSSTGDLGVSTVEPVSTPSTIPGPFSWSGVSAGDEHTCGITADNLVWCWGANHWGQLGVGETSFYQTPQPIAFSAGLLDVSAGLTSTCAVVADHALWCWGANGAGQLGDGTAADSSYPTPVDRNGARDWQSVSVGTNHACGIRGTGSLYCWGSNHQGQLGLGNTSDEDEHAPKQVGIATDWISVVAGTQQTCGTRPSGLYCWGDRARAPAPRLMFGGDWRSVTLHASPQLEAAGAHGLSIDLGGSCDMFDILSPPMLDNHGVTSNQTALSWGQDHACAIEAGGGMYCWGHNNAGQLGVDTLPPDFETTIGGPAGAWSDVDAGGYATCAIMEGSEELYCWGTNTLLGAPTTETRNPKPSNVEAGTKWSKISVGHRHACAIKKADGSLWCWGDNLQGELGSGGPSGANHPRRVHPS